MRALRALVAAVLAAGIVTVVAAQPGGGGRFGGGGGDVSTFVLSNTALQEELKVTDAQKEKFKPVADKQAALNKKRGEMFGKGKGFDKEKFAELQEEGKKVAEELKKVLDDTLTADQKKRLKQINVQVMSVNVFSDPDTKFGQFPAYNDAQKATMKEVTDALKLTDAQRTKIKEITDEYGKDRAAIRKDVFGDAKGKGAFDQEKQKDFNSKAGKLSEETLAKIAGVLDETQKKTWKELTGEAFDTSKLFQPRTQPKKD